MRRLLVMGTLLFCTALSHAQLGLTGVGGPPSGGGAPVAITYGATCNAQHGSSATTLSCSSALTISAGTYVVVGCDTPTATATITASDGTNSYAAISSAAVNGTSNEAQLFGFYYVSGGTVTPRCNYSISTTFQDIIATTYMNVATSSPTDGSATGTGTGTSATTSTNITTTQCGDVIVEYSSSSGTGTPSVSSPFTMRNAPSGNDNGLADYITTGTVTQGGAMTMVGSSGRWAIAATALKAQGPC